ncbi:OLC1v1003250C1 [Oldenlandia corymbosa var. corymbosa]|uniref:OLC1v1003250C1 n=1 Tax=Oldenlandia corymbosa var. corymbosa TaxID=529605 RepID=A0AAV1DAE7_OLDCO|nr:OLC1v1003250C1 [Oldenlandia corymbosa var. corymbosa]
MCWECIQFYNQQHDDQTERYRYCGKVENVAFSTTSSYSSSQVTFTGSLVDDSSGINITGETSFVGQYVVYHHHPPKGAVAAEEEALFCEKKEEFLADWEQRKKEPCQLGCCVGYRSGFPGFISETFREFVRDSWEDRRARSRKHNLHLLRLQGLLRGTSQWSAVLCHNNN